MKAYKIQRMTEDNWHKYMGGSYNYEFETIVVYAESKSQAIKIAEAQSNNYKINNWVEEIK